MITLTFQHNRTLYNTHSSSSSSHIYIYTIRIETGRPARVKTAAHLLRRLVYQNKNNLSAGCIVAGWDAVDGGSVYNITMGGSMLKVPFAIGGSGSSYVYGMMDAKFHSMLVNSGDQPLEKEEGLTLVQQVVAHAMARDGGSGGCIRTVTLTRDGGIEYSFTPGNELPFGPTAF
jgi:20S proteasome subunit beta 1